MIDYRQLIDAAEFKAQLRLTLEAIERIQSGEDKNPERTLAIRKELIEKTLAESDERWANPNPESLPLVRGVRAAIELIRRKMLNKILYGNEDE